MKIYSHHKIIICLSILLVSLISCKIQQSSSYSKRLNLSFLYNPNVQQMVTHIAIHNTNDSITTVHCQIPTQQLLFLPIGEHEVANVLVYYQLFKVSDGLKRLDTNTIHRSFIKDTARLTEYSTIELPIKDTGKFMLDFYISDKNKNIAYHNYFDIERKLSFSVNDFLITNKNGIPYSEKWLCDSDTFKIILRKNIPKEWKFSWYPNTFKIASPPYSMTTNKDFVIPSPDSIRVKWVCDTCLFVLNRKGILHVFRDTIGNGFTLFNFSTTYPKMKRPSELLQPIRMLTSQKEFNELNILSDKKEAIDKFWLNTSGNADRARELIRVFYSRVFLANTYFTSYTEGWKTDRGIIYIIFGLPTTIYKAPNLEQWIYGTPESSKTLFLDYLLPSIKLQILSNGYMELQKVQKL